MTAWNEEPIVFRCGQEHLVGVIHRSARRGAGVGVLVVVGGPQYRAGSHRQFTLMARSLAAIGIPVMRFDHRGMGDSDGHSHGFAETASDIAAGIEAFCLAVPTIDRVVLWGLCDAASAILMHGCHDARVGALVLANPWVQTGSSEAESYLRHYYVQRIWQRSFWIKLLGMRVNLCSSLHDWLGKIRRARRIGQSASFVEQMHAGLSGFGGPVLILLSESDFVARQFNDLCQESEVWRAAVGRENVSIHHVAAADHTFSSRAALDAATIACGEWLTRLETHPCR